MNNEFFAVQPLKRWLQLRLLSLLLAGTTMIGLPMPLFGQSNTDSTTSFDQEQPDLSKGYWRLKTQAATHNTVIEFFGPNRQLLYQETISGQWVKLNRRNRKRFDTLLERLVANELLRNYIKVKALPASNSPTVQPKIASLSGLEQADGSYEVNAFLLESSKLMVAVNNPLNKRIIIKLVDENGRLLYNEYAYISQYRRKFDFSETANGPYRVIIQINNQFVTYRLHKRPMEQVYELRPQLPVNEQMTKASKSY